MDDELIWKMRARRLDGSIRDLCREAVADDRLDRLRDVNLMLHDIEREILDQFQFHERGEEATKPIRPLFRPLMRWLEAFYCVRGLAWEWEASKIRTRLRQEQEEC